MWIGPIELPFAIQIQTYTDDSFPDVARADGPVHLEGWGMVMEIAEAGIDEIQVTEVPGRLTAAVAEI